MAFVSRRAATKIGAMPQPTAAYQQAGHTLCVKDRDDPLTEMIAKKIIEIAQTGIKDPAQISALAIKELEIR
jgi:hypothetical protein